MNRTKKLASLIGAGVLLFAVAGIAFASAPGATEQGISPVAHAGRNITISGNGSPDKANCDAADAVSLDGNGQATTTNGVTVHLTTGAGESGEQNNEVDFTVDNGVVTIAYVKGGHGYNTYDYTGLGGVTSDNDLYGVVNGSGNPAGLSHAVFCTSVSEESSSSTSFSSTVESTTDSSSSSSSSTTSFSSTVESTTDTQPPTDTIGSTSSGQQSGGMWLLIAGLGMLLGSVIVLAPAKTRK